MCSDGRPYPPCLLGSVARSVVAWQGTDKEPFGDLSDTGRVEQEAEAKSAAPANGLGPPPRVRRVRPETQPRGGHDPLEKPSYHLGTVALSWTKIISANVSPATSSANQRRRLWALRRTEPIAAVDRDPSGTECERLGKLGLKPGCPLRKILLSIGNLSACKVKGLNTIMGFSQRESSFSAASP
ncbi:hypothetical protein SKAU_G00402620 [Synaphobranchus kaupii]|uniref:Uncharacterized protein n=1 Tax=Synaphobranchus kaupii TaxID=118154 RepID=A0A9Q1E9B8_SYNKA|nr:hypothetical protein SKAU_G00402620 [Synaphobranchus kaupii]